MADEMTIALDIATAKMRLARLQARTAALHGRMADAESTLDVLDRVLTLHVAGKPTETAAGMPNAPPATPAPQKEADRAPPAAMFPAAEQAATPADPPPASV